MIHTMITIIIFSLTFWYAYQKILMALGAKIQIKIVPIQQDPDEITEEKPIWRTDEEWIPDPEET